MRCVFWIILVVVQQRLGGLVKKQLTQAAGFTLLELLVVTIIVGILATMAMVYYYGAIERSRMTEVLTLIGTEITAQERRYMTVRRYTKYWHQLDAQPSYVRTPSADNKYANGAENSIFYTRGKDSDGTPKDGFQVYFEQKGHEWYMVADRVSSDDYDYTLVRPFHDQTVYCLPKADSKRAQVLCADFMGVENATLLPADPR